VLNKVFNCLFSKVSGCKCFEVVYVEFTFVVCHSESVNEVSGRLALLAHVSVAVERQEQPVKRVLTHHRLGL